MEYFVIRNNRRKEDEVVKLEVRPNILHVTERLSSRSDYLHCLRKPRLRSVTSESETSTTPTGRDLLELQLLWLLGNLLGDPEIRIVVSNSTELLTQYTVYI
jgi:hypothetical protein